MKTYLDKHKIESMCHSRSALRKFYRGFFRQKETVVNVLTNIGFDESREHNVVFRVITNTIEIIQKKAGKGGKKKGK